MVGVSIAAITVVTAVPTTVPIVTITVAAAATHVAIVGDTSDHGDSAFNSPRTAGEVN